MAQFNRIYQLTVSSADKLLPDPNTPWKYSILDSYREIKTLKAIVEDLRIVCSIDLTTTNSNSTFTEIQVYNAGENLLHRLKQPDAYLTLAAGYSLDLNTNTEISPNELPIIFVGDVLEVETKKKGADVITKIKAKDSNRVRKSSYISAVFIGATPITKRLLDIVNKYMPTVSVGDINIGVVNLDGSIRKQTSENDYVAYGRVEDILDELARDFDFIWYIVNNKFYAHPKFYEKARELVVLEPKNIIDNVYPANSTNNTGNTRDKAGLKFKTFLDGRIDTSKYVRLKGFENDTDGDYKIVQVKHVMDSRGANWYTDLTVSGV